MKKAYETPKVEKMAFNYSEAVVASTSGCYWGGEYTHGGEPCTTTLIPGTAHWINNQG